MKQLEFTDEELQVLFWMNSIAFLNRDLLIPGFKEPYQSVHDKLMKLQAEIMIEQVYNFNFEYRQKLYEEMKAKCSKIMEKDETT